MPLWPALLCCPGEGEARSPESYSWEGAEAALLHPSCLKGQGWLPCAGAHVTAELEGQHRMGPALLFMATIEGWISSQIREAEQSTDLKLRQIAFQVPRFGLCATMTSFSVLLYLTEVYII